MKIGNRQQLLMILAAVLVGLFLADRVVFTPLFRLWRSRAQTILEMKEKYLSGIALLERKAVVETQWTSMCSNMLSGPSSKAEDQFLKAVERWAQDSRVTLAAVKPQWQRVGNPRSAEPITILECNLEAGGNLAAITRFIYNIERDPLGIRISRAQITARDDAGEQLTLNLQLSALALVNTTDTK